MSSIAVSDSVTRRDKIRGAEEDAASDSGVRDTRKLCVRGISVRKEFRRSTDDEPSESVDTGDIVRRQY